MNIRALVVAATLFVLPPLQASTPEQDKAFVDQYNAALKAMDPRTAMEALLYKEGARPEHIKLATVMLMLPLDPKGEVSNVELRALTPAQVEKYDKSIKAPDGTRMRLTAKPTKELVVSRRMKDSTSLGGMTSSSFPVAEKDGRLVVPVPAPVAE